MRTTIKDEPDTDPCSCHIETAHFITTSPDATPTLLDGCDATRPWLLTSDSEDNISEAGDIILTRWTTQTRITNSKQATRTTRSNKTVKMEPMDEADTPRVAAPAKKQTKEKPASPSKKIIQAYFYRNSRRVYIMTDKPKGPPRVRKAKPPNKPVAVAVRKTNKLELVQSKAAADCAQESSHSPSSTGQDVIMADASSRNEDEDLQTNDDPMQDVLRRIHQHISRLTEEKAQCMDEIRAADMELEKTEEDEVFQQRKHEEEEIAIKKASEEKIKFLEEQIKREQARCINETNNLSQTLQLQLEQPNKLRHQKNELTTKVNAMEIQLERLQKTLSRMEDNE